MTPAPLPDDIAEAGWKAMTAMSVLLHAHNQLGSALTNEHQRQRLLAQVQPALDLAQLSARLFAQMAETELKKRDPSRG